MHTVTSPAGAREHAPGLERVESSRSLGVAAPPRRRPAPTRVGPAPPDSASSTPAPHAALRAVPTPPIRSIRPQRLDWSVIHAVRLPIQRSTMESTGMPAPLGLPGPSRDRCGSSGQPATGRPTSRDWIGMRTLDPGAAKRRRRRMIRTFCDFCASLRQSRSLFPEPAKRWLHTWLPGRRSAVREYTADDHEEGITLSNHSVEANRRPAAPPEAGSQFGSPFSARPDLPAAVAHLWR